MVTTRGKKMKMSREATHESGWRTLANMEPCLMENIFRRVPLDDLLASVSLVCPSWQSACCQFLFWNCKKVLDLSATGYTANSPVRICDSDLATIGKGFFGRFKNEEDCKDAAMNLSKLLELVMEGDDVNGSSVAAWRKKIRTIFFPYELQISNEHILYIAKRTPSIEHLILLDPTRITGRGFAKAIQYWKNLKELHIGVDMKCDARKFTHFIKEAGRCCRYLEVLHIHHPMFRVNRANSEVIAKNLPKLKMLDFNNCLVFGSGILVFSRISCPLEKICFYNCRRVNSSYSIPDELSDTGKDLLGRESFALIFTHNVGQFNDFRMKYEGGAPYALFNDIPQDNQGFKGVLKNWLIAWSCMD